MEEKEPLIVAVFDCLKVHVCLGQIGRTLKKYMPMEIHKKAPISDDMCYDLLSCVLEESIRFVYAAEDMLEDKKTLLETILRSNLLVSILEKPSKNLAAFKEAIMYLAKASRGEATNAQERVRQQTVIYMNFQESMIDNKITLKGAICSLLHTTLKTMAATERICGVSPEKYARFLLKLALEYAGYIELVYSSHLNALIERVRREWEAGCIPLHPKHTYDVDETLFGVLSKEAIFLCNPNRSMRPVLCGSAGERNLKDILHHVCARMFLLGTIKRYRSVALNEQYFYCRLMMGVYDNSIKLELGRRKAGDCIVYAASSLHAIRAFKQTVNQKLLHMLFSELDKKEAPQPPQQKCACTDAGPDDQESSLLDRRVLEPLSPLQKMYVFNKVYEYASILGVKLKTPHYVKLFRRKACHIRRVFAVCAIFFLVFAICTIFTCFRALARALDK
ncbi:uncharacterized protein NEMAJ01_1347 [Nematocida major]|uniref:uncharacterized protein n=1 Tax=Nematocida major TaxID=1912982 RepID=UPI0020085DA0|nr:uncharacterized protein NEMAJ01_1347 [Nematocida major]KAH9386451.1 hypothetical protein NEMAJ01_1347 [Nematocida major]